jgi:hypothetical protein
VRAWRCMEGCLGGGGAELIMGEGVGESTLGMTVMAMSLVDREGSRLRWGGDRWLVLPAA